MPAGQTPRKGLATAGGFQLDRSHTRYRRAILLLVAVVLHALTHFNLESLRVHEAIPRHHFRDVFQRHVASFDSIRQEITDLVFSKLLLGFRKFPLRFQCSARGPDLSQQIVDAFLQFIAFETDDE